MQNEMDLQDKTEMEELDEDVLQTQKAQLEQEIDKSKSIMEARKKEMRQIREQYKQEMELRKKEMKITHQNWVRQRPDRLVKRLVKICELIIKPMGVFFHGIFQALIG